MKNIPLLLKWAGVLTIIALLLLPSTDQNVKAAQELSPSFQGSLSTSPQEAVLTENDLPGFGEAEEIEVVGYLALARRITLGLLSPQTEIANISAFRIKNLFRSEYVISFLAYPISENDESAFDALADNPQSILNTLYESAKISSNAEEPRLLSELGDIGEKSMGFSMTLGQDPVARNIDLIWVRRGDIIQSIWMVYPIGENPSINLHQLGLLVDQRVVERFPGTTFRQAGSLVPDITTHIPTPLDISTKPSVIGTNLLLAALMMLPFALAAEIFTHLSAESEELLRDKFRLIRWLYSLPRRFENFLGTRIKHRGAAATILRLLLIMFFYGVTFSLLDRTWNPLSVTGLVLFLNMTVAYGIVGIADDIMQWKVLKKWGLPAEINIRPTNILIAAVSTITSRLLTLVPGLMFGTPEALIVNELRLEKKRRNYLLKISACTLLGIGFGLWALTIVTTILQRQNISDTFGNFIAGLEGFLLVVFAVALENTFVKMLGLPGSFGEAIRKRNRWFWLLGLMVITFVFYHTLINPRGELIEALQESNVWIFFGVSGAFVIFSLVLWAYIMLKGRKPAKTRQSYANKSKRSKPGKFITSWVWLAVLVIGITVIADILITQRNQGLVQLSNRSTPSAGESTPAITLAPVTEVRNEGDLLFTVPVMIKKLCYVPSVNIIQDRSDGYIWKGIQLTAAQYGAQAVYSSPETLDEAGYTKVIDQLVQENCDLIIGYWLNQYQVYQSMARAYPDQNFMLVGYSSGIEYQHPNLWEVEYYLPEGAYLAGYLAAAASQSGMVGTFGGDQIPISVSTMNCFALGVRDYNAVHLENVVVLGWDIDNQQGLFAGDFMNPDQGIYLANQLYSQGADIVFPVAGASINNTGYGTGVVARQHAGVYVLGVDLDWAWALPEFEDVVLTSVETRYDQSITIAVDALANGVFHGGAHKGTLASGEIRLSPLRDFSYLVSSNIQDELAQMADSSLVSSCQAPQPLEPDLGQNGSTLIPDQTPAAESSSAPGPTRTPKLTATPSSTPSPTHTPAPTTTPDQRVYNLENGHWYLVIQQSTWNSARDDCSSRGAHLLIIESASEDKFIYSLEPTALLGATDRDNEGYWVWVTGESLPYTNWNENEPCNCGGPDHNLPENYVNYFGSSAGPLFKWNDVSEESGNYICEWE